ncbi:hypothetical protein [Ferrovibrio sp.]|jgi:uncharacterized BrkB/YihY/UPF0761 family membrane protein|uniref:hypothetical protein n=1 Tax=Ferrovibrio sp. TaxID=1917215 RepID=UPI0035AF68FC
MPDLSPDTASSPAGSPPDSSGRGWRLLTILLCVLLAIPLLSMIIVAIEASATVIARDFAHPYLGYWVIRVSAYAALLTLAAFAIFRFVPQGRRRPYWIGLGIAAPLLIVDASARVLALLIGLVTALIFRAIG